MCECLDRGDEFVLCEVCRDTWLEILNGDSVLLGRERARAFDMIVANARKHHPRTNRIRGCPSCDGLDILDKLDAEFVAALTPKGDQ